MISLVIPCHGGDASNIERTINSAKGVCDEVIIISTAMFNEDLCMFHQLTDKVVELPWNFTFMHGFGHMMNQGSSFAKNDWLILLGVSETIHTGHQRIIGTLPHAPSNNIYLCDHINDPNRWRRCWNRKSGSHWGGIIHESIGGGQDAGVLFEMRDTPKAPMQDPLKNECMKFLKACLYNQCYKRLLEHPEELSFTDPGWIGFVNGAKESIIDFCDKHSDMLYACMTGNFGLFIKLVEGRMEASKTVSSVNFNPTGTPMTEGA